MGLKRPILIFGPDKLNLPHMTAFLTLVITNMYLFMAVPTPLIMF